MHWIHGDRGDKNLNANVDQWWQVGLNISMATNSIFQSLFSNYTSPFSIKLCAYISGETNGRNRSCRIFFNHRELTWKFWRQRERDHQSKHLCVSVLDCAQIEHFIQSWGLLENAPQKQLQKVTSFFEYLRIPVSWEF